MFVRQTCDAIQVHDRAVVALHRKFNAEKADGFATLNVCRKRALIGRGFPPLSLIGVAGASPKPSAAGPSSHMLSSNDFARQACPMFTSASW
jgi:hypothetical protein